MKKRTLSIASALLVILLANPAARAQQWGTSGIPTTTLDQVGIGTITPTASLDIVETPRTSSTPKLKIKVDNSLFLTPPSVIEVSNTNLDLYHVLNGAGKTGLGMTPIDEDRLSTLGDVSITNNGTVFSNLRARAPQTGFSILENSNWFNGPSIWMYGKDNTSQFDNPGEIKMFSLGLEGRGFTYISVDPTKSEQRTRVRFMNNGQVIIGDQAPSGDYAGYKLGVDGVVVCKRAIVQTGSWADFVFQPDYVLPTLEKVAAYIDANHHLPGVPSAACVAEQGVDVGDMNKILLQKVEELTLYMIQLKKANEELADEIDNLKSK